MWLSQSVLCVTLFRSLLFSRSHCVIFFLNLNLLLDTQKKTGTKHAHSAYHTSVWRKLRSAHLIGVSATCQYGADTKLGKKTRR